MNRPALAVRAAKGDSSGMRSSSLVSVLVVALGGAALCSCSGKPQPPPCDPVASAWTPSPIPTPYASTSASASSSATSGASPPPKSPYTLEQLLSVKKSVAPSAIDDESFLYLYDKSGTAQVWVHHGITGPTTLAPSNRALTDLPDRVGAVRASPDGKHAVFTVDHGGDENFQIDLLGVAAPDEGAIHPLTAAPKVRHTLPSFDDKGARIAYTANARNGKDMDLFVLTLPKGGTDAKASEKEPVFVELTGSWSVSDWRGEKILLQEERSSFDQDLWIVDAKTKQKKLLTKHTGEERWYDAHFSRDGKAIFALTDTGRDFVGVSAIEIATGKRKAILEIDHDVITCATPRWSVPASKFKPPAKPPKNAKDAFPDAIRYAEDLFVCAINDEGVDQVRIVAVDEARTTSANVAAPVSGVVSSIAISSTGASALVAVEDATHPPEIDALAVRTSSTSEVVTHSDHAGVDPSQLVPASLERFTTFDGRSISYFFYAKKDGDSSAKRSCVVLVHGGPEAQAQPNFSALVEYFALSGYAVAAPNVRGSTGYGKAFAHLDDKDKRLDAVHDLSELGKHLASRPDVDGSRIALVGGSYGGFMVLAGLAFHPKQWAAGVDIVGIANFRTFLEQTAPYRRALREAEYGSLEKDGAMLDAISPIHKVDQVVAPLMVIHGTNDPRVPVGEAKQIAEALQKRKIPVELMIFDDEGHGLSKLKNRLVAYPAAVKFLDTYLKKSP